MTIYILGTRRETAEALDDKSLNQMIKDIAQVLCDVHWLTFPTPLMENSPPLKCTKDDIWSKWARECVANYSYLVELGLTLWDEWEIRFTYKYGKPSRHHKQWKVLAWARNNVPDLPNRNDEIGCGCNDCDKGFENNPTSFPLVVPGKYLIGAKLNNQWIYRVVESYRNYYQSKLQKRLTQKDLRPDVAKASALFLWSRRKKPDWLTL